MLSKGAAGRAKLSSLELVLTSTLLLTLGGFDRVIYSQTNAMTHFGIAPGAPELPLSLVALTILTVRMLRFGPIIGRIVMSALLFVATLTLMAAVAWNGDTREIQSGILHLASALLAYCVGRALSLTSSHGQRLVISSSIFAILLTQLVACIFQWMNRPLLDLAPDAQDWVADGRMVGTFNHPGILGKVAFLLLAFLLPLAAGRDRSAYIARWAIAFGGLATLATLSRANIVAYLAAVLLFTQLSKQLRLGSRLAALLAFTALLLGASPILGALIERNRLDPTGGYRPYLFEVGITQIGRNPIVGIGPNSYSAIVGDYDRFAAQGFPIHNTFLLVVAEIGIPLAILFFLPIFQALLDAVIRLGTRSTTERSIAVLAMVPGLLLITLTGWGLAAGSSLILWFLGFGMLVQLRGDSAIPPGKRQRQVVDSGGAR